MGCESILQVYVSRAKRKVLEALDLPREYRALMTENDREATIQAVRGHPTFSQPSFLPEPVSQLRQQISGHA